MVWILPPTGKRGRRQQFSDAAFQACLTLKVLFGMNRLLFAGDPEVRILGYGKDEERNTLSGGLARAVRMVLDHESEYASRSAAILSISQKVGCSSSRDSLRIWVRQQRRIPANVTA